MDDFTSQIVVMCAAWWAFVGFPIFFLLSFSLNSSDSVFSFVSQLALYLQGERNFNRFGGCLGKNSTMGKNLRLLDDLHVHILASRESSSGR